MSQLIEYKGFQINVLEDKSRFAELPFFYEIYDPDGGELSSEENFATHDKALIDAKRWIDESMEE